MPERNNINTYKGVVGVYVGSMDLLWHEYFNCQYGLVLYCW